MIQKIGPHGIGFSNEEMAWAAIAPIVKGMDNIQILQAAHPQAIRIFRHFFQNPNYSDPQSTVQEILAALQGYRHPNLYVEIWNETHVPTTSQWTAAVGLLHAEGIHVAGPSWGTGDYTDADWQMFRSAKWCGFDLIALHCYWADAGQTPWNAYRYRQFWRTGDPFVVITESGRDIVRDGPDNTYIGKGGYIADGITVPAYCIEVANWDSGISGDSYVVGAVIYTCAPTPKWVNYQADALKDYMIQNTRGGPVMKDTYPPAKWVTTDHEWQGRKNNKVVAIVDHIAQGGEAGIDATFTDHTTQDPVSAHFAVDVDGSVHQYVLITDTAWANGVVEPGNTIPKQFTPGVNPNYQTISIEHAGFSGTSLTPAQYQASLALHIWIIEQLNSLGVEFPIDGEHVIGHNRISPKSRPNCPGPAFDFLRLLKDLSQHFHGLPPPPKWEIGSGFEQFLKDNPDYGSPRENAWPGIHGDMFLYVTATPVHPQGPLLIWRKSTNKIDASFIGK